MILEIPDFRQNEFDKAVRKLNKMGLGHGIQDLGLDAVKGPDGEYYQVHKYDVPTDYEYSVPGWHFIGTIEHLGSGNVIRQADTTVEVPEYYRTAPAECEHCHTIRSRNDTYLVMSDDGDFKQVGKTCLKAYTGLNPAVCTWIMSLDAYLRSLSDIPSDGGEFFRLFGGSIRMEPVKEIESIALQEIKTNGFKPSSEEGSTASELAPTQELGPS